MFAAILSEALLGNGTVHRKGSCSQSSKGEGSKGAKVPWFGSDYDHRIAFHSRRNMVPVPVMSGFPQKESTRTVPVYGVFPTSVL